MSQTPRLACLRFCLHTSGVFVLYFAIVFFLQAMLWDADSGVQNFSRPVHTFLAALVYFIALLCVAALHGWKAFGKTILSVPKTDGFSSVAELWRQNLRLVHSRTPSLWIVLWLEIPLGLSVLLYEAEHLLLYVFPPRHWQNYLSRFLLEPAPSTSWEVLTAFAAFLLFLPICEEVLFRGWGLGIIRRYLGQDRFGLRWKWAAIFWLNLGFALSFANPWQFFVMLPLGLLLSWIRLASESLWAALIVRMMLSFLGLVYELWGLPMIGIQAGPLPNKNGTPAFLLLLALFLTGNAVWYLYKRSKRLEIGIK